MIRLTKIFHFEMAHALHGYPGDCKNIHGHSYKLHVTLESSENFREFIPGHGMLIDFREIKSVVNTFVLKTFDHKLLLSRNFLSRFPITSIPDNLVIWDVEPTAENMLIYIKNSLTDVFPPGLRLAELKLYETRDSYAEMILEIEK
jgi:6-pyruvoyltetrahydropterin/6-carboxytetrahydropterin synthase